MHRQPLKKTKTSRSGQWKNSENGAINGINSWIWQQSPKLPRRFTGRRDEWKFCGTIILLESLHCQVSVLILWFWCLKFQTRPNFINRTLLIAKHSSIDLIRFLLFVAQKHNSKPKSHVWNALQMSEIWADGDATGLRGCCGHPPDRGERRLWAGHASVLTQVRREN